MVNYPHRWFVNIVAIQEKRPFHITNVFLFTVFVAIVRMLGEWVLAGNEDQLYLTDFIISIGFYWFCFFAYTFVLWLLVPQPWQRSMNVILVGIFLGILPPVVDVLVSGAGNFRYGFLWDFPAGFSPWLYSPEHRIPAGEAGVLWATVFFTALYVSHRTRDVVMGVAAGVVAWIIAVFNAALLPASIKAVQESLGFGPQHRLFLITTAYFALTLLIYFAFQPRFAKGLLSRALHAVPFVLMTVAGAAFAGELRIDAAFYAFFVGVTFLTALGHNDWHDRADDAAQGRAPYLDGGDVDFLNVVGFGLAALLVVHGSFTGLLLVLILAVSILYSYSGYRAKRYFPSNLKIEGVWGASAFLVGIVAQSEYAAYGAPSWSVVGNPKGHTLGAFPPATLTAILLVFGGYSLIASLKDYKDRDADLAAGVQTWYTLARKRGWNEAQLHRLLVGAACLALLLPFPLLAWAERIPLVTAAGALPAAAAVWVLMQGAPSERRFRLTLAAISGQLAYLTALLAWPG